MRGGTAMRRVLRTTLLILATVTLVLVAIRVIAACQRFKEQQFVDGEIKPSGSVARTYARVVPWWGHWAYGAMADRLDLQAEDDVLDVACGSGAFLRAYAAHVHRVAGLDHSDDLIAIAENNNQERVAAGTAEFVVGDATALPWEDGEFSAVTSNCISCFESKSEQTLREMHRVLRPGGRAVVEADRVWTMEYIGFVDVTKKRSLWGTVTTGYKAAA
jgi:SAM-dependent methyltransferase